MRVPVGSGLLLVGSGLYWTLSSQLIGSFSVLAPEALRFTPLGTTFVLVFGLLASVAGLWVVPSDFERLVLVLEGEQGWVYAMPILLVVGDVFLTLAGLGWGVGVELNLFVASAVQAGSLAMVPFVVSYLALSEGLGLLMLDLGRRTFGLRPAGYLPFSVVCGAASLGPASNFALLLAPRFGILVYVFGALASFLLGGVVYKCLLSVRVDEELFG